MTRVTLHYTILHVRLRDSHLHVRIEGLLALEILVSVEPEFVDAGGEGGGGGEEAGGATVGVGYTENTECL